MTQPSWILRTNFYHWIRTEVGMAVPNNFLRVSREPKNKHLMLMKLVSKGVKYYCWIKLQTSIGKNLRFSYPSVFDYVRWFAWIAARAVSSRVAMRYENTKPTNDSRVVSELSIYMLRTFGPTIILCTGCYISGLNMIYLMITYN